MTDPPIPPDADDLVGQVVERTAIKLAEAGAPPTISHNIESWIRIGVMGVVVLTVMALANLVMNIQTKNAVEEVNSKVQSACRLLSLIPNINEPPSPVRLAECLR